MSEIALDWLSPQRIKAVLEAQPPNMAIDTGSKHE